MRNPSVLINPNYKTPTSQYGVQENSFADWLGIGSAQRNRQFEAYMSNTAYQRAVADMQSAGLNPAQVFASGASSASTPSGSSAGIGVGPGQIAGTLYAISNVARTFNNDKDKGNNINLGQAISMIAQVAKFLS